jgi:hypothetical protein
MEREGGGGVRDGCHAFERKLLRADEALIRVSKKRAEEERNARRGGKKYSQGGGGFFSSCWRSRSSNCCMRALRLKR